MSDETIDPALAEAEARLERALERIGAHAQAANIPSTRAGSAPAAVAGRVDALIALVRDALDPAVPHPQD